MGPWVSKGSGEQYLARTLWPRLEEGWLLSADRLFYNWADWCAASDTGTDLLWRVKDDLRLPYLELLPDGSYRSVLVKTAQHRRRPRRADRGRQARGGPGPGAARGTGAGGRVRGR